MDLNTNQASFLGTTLETGKMAFDARLFQLAKQDSDVAKIAAALYGENPTQQAVDATIYAAKSVGAVKTFDDLFKSDDKISVGIASLSEGKPAAGDYFLATHIALQYAVAAGTTDADVKAANFGLISSLIRNGEIKMSQNNREILPSQSCEIFYAAKQVVVAGDNNVAAGTAIVNTFAGFGDIGLYKLENPKWIYPDRKLDVSLKFADALPANSAVRMIIYGVKNGKL